MTVSKTKTMNKNNELVSVKLKGLSSLSQFERNIAKKMMLSIRYFCEDNSNHTEKSLKRCLDPVVRLSPSLMNFLSQIELAGVVLFAENILSVEQTKMLTSDLQKAGRQAGSTNYLIGIDQEGGRVVRIPRDIGTSFSGNMAIGATYDYFGDQFATTVGSVIGKELDSLGINLNFSPDVDVNNNPDNPVINIRSFGEDPLRVSELGLAMMNSLQEQNVMATLKHFPGHGNTHVDSHTGLPTVDFSKTEMDKIEFVPFKYAIDKGDPAMVMTAHIQYPQLDPTKVINKHGEAIIVPATMSHKLMTKILKDELGFKGVVISDAMNMAGISANFDLANATAHSFLAGVDISLMPYSVRNQKEIDGFIPFVKTVAQLMRDLSSKQWSTKELLDTTRQSIASIESVKIKYHSVNQSKVKSKWTNNKYRKLEQALSEKSISAVRLDKKVFPLAHSKELMSVHILIRNNDQKEVVENAFENFSLTTKKNNFKLSFTLLNTATIISARLNSEIEHLIVFEQNGAVSAVDIGETGDEITVNSKTAIKTTKDTSLNVKHRENIISDFLDLASKQSIPTTLIASQSPYDVIPYLDDKYKGKINSILIAYDASVYWDEKNNKKVGKGFRAIISALIGRTEVQGKLPVKI